MSFKIVLHHPALTDLPAAEISSLVFAALDSFYVWAGVFLRWKKLELFSSIMEKQMFF